MSEPPAGHRDPRRVSVGITTRNRADSLIRAITSLTYIDAMVSEVLVFDDASSTPVESQLEGRVPASLDGRVEVIRSSGNVGQQAGRTRIAKRARSEMLLLLDDDVGLLDGRGVAEAADIMRRDSAVAAVAFAQATGDGAPWPSALQPAPVSYPCYVPAFIGFAHLLRRDPFLALGGYRTTFFYHGEEKELCLRLLDVGLQIVYLPHVRVAHFVDLEGRDRSTYLRYVTKNDCLTALYNDPWWRLWWTLPGRFVRYFQMKRGVRDPQGVRWLVRELWSALPDVWSERRPLDAGTFRRWNELRDTSPAYTVPPA